MAKKDVYYWRGPGKLMGRSAGEQIDKDAMDKGQFDKMVKDGRIQRTAFDIAEDTSVVAELKKKVETLSNQVVELNKKIKESGDCENCKTLEAEVEKLTGELEAATAPSDDDKE
jgi:peptidoglycan hydrolase CwlO-like protein